MESVPRYRIYGQIQYNVSQPMPERGWVMRNSILFLYECPALGDTNKTLDLMVESQQTDRKSKTLYIKILLKSVLYIYH